MVEMETRPPQISEMFQKFALAFKTKTFELLAGDEDDDPTTASFAAETDADMFTLLDSAEGFIPDQKVVVIKPDGARSPKPGPSMSSHLAQRLIASLFAAISSFEASYIQLQAAHVPFNEKALESADKALVAILQKLTDVKRNFRNFQKNPTLDFDFAGGSSFLEFQVQENQSKLRALETMVNQLQSDIDNIDEEVMLLRKKLDKIEVSNSKLTKRLGPESEKLNKDVDIVLSFRVFECMLSDCVKALHVFTKLLIDLMKKGGWDLELAANSVYCDVDYVKKGHNKYAFLSYVCLGMFRGFDSDGFGICEDLVVCDELLSSKDVYLKQLIEHVACNPMEILGKNPKCDFSRFCEDKYEQLIHQSMESSIFSNFDGKEALLSSWKSLRVFYESFVRVASSIWLLHKLAYSFNPAVEIFQVERGADFSMVHMEDVARKAGFPLKTRPKVAFTVVPGFKVGRTVIQSQVYLTESKCTD